MLCRKTADRRNQFSFSNFSSCSSKNKKRYCTLSQLQHHIIISLPMANIGRHIRDTGSMIMIMSKIVFYVVVLLVVAATINIGDDGFVGTVESLSLDTTTNIRRTVVTYGPQARELILLTSKLAAKDGYDSFCICAPGQEGKSRKLMYGIEVGDDDDVGSSDNGDDDDPKQQQQRAEPISSPDDIQNALTKANVLILVCYDSPIEEKSLNTLLNTAASGNNDQLSKIVLISKMGVSSSGGGGGFFNGGGNSKLLDSENKIRSICKSKNIDLSIVRAGQVKGGGPGEPSENDYGLNKAYYNTLLDLSEASVSMSHDRFTLGVDCTKGDSVDVPNIFTLLGTKSTFEAAPYDSSRINVAKAAVLAASYNKPVEFSVSSKRSETLPSKEEWETILEKMTVS